MTLLRFCSATLLMVGWLGLYLPESASGLSKVTQVELVNFPSHGSVDIRAVETSEELPRLDFFSAGRKVFSIELGKSEPDVFRPTSEFAYVNPFVRFKSFRIPGFPSPFILAVAVAPGGSDYYFESTLIGEVGGEFKVLNAGPLIHHIDGGVFIGYVNNEIGASVVTWDFIWGDEAHFEPHRYRVQIFTWNNNCSCLQKRQDITTEEKHNGWEEALSKLKLPIENFIPNVAGVNTHSTLGIENQSDNSKEHLNKSK